jgi:MFS family permease
VIFTTILTYFFIPESPVKTPGKINFTGAFLMSAGLAALLLSISQGSDWGWASPKTLGLGAVAILLLLAWVRAELRADTPLVDMRMMQIKGVWTTNMVALLIGVGMYSSFILIPQLVLLPPSTGIGFGVTATEAGLFLLPSTIAMLVVGPFAGKLEHRFGSKPPLIAGVFFTLAAFVMLAFIHGAKIDIYFASLLLGVGIGLSFAAMANLIVQSVKQTQTGVATGMNTVMRSLGGAVGATIAATILTAKLGTDGLPTESGFVWAFSFCAIALIAAAGFGFLVPGRSPAEELEALRPTEPPVAERVAVEV